MKKFFIVLLVFLLAPYSVLFATGPVIDASDPSPISVIPEVVTVNKLEASLDLSTVVKNGIAVGFSEVDLPGQEYELYDQNIDSICTAFTLTPNGKESVIASSGKTYYLRWKVYSKDNLYIYLKLSGKMMEKTEATDKVSIHWMLSSVSTPTQEIGGVSATGTPDIYNKTIKVYDYKPKTCGVYGSYGFTVKTENLINKPTEKTYEGSIIAEIRTV